MSLWRKRKNCDNIAPNVVANVHHSEQKQDNLVNILNNLSIKSDDLSIKREKAMREVQRLGQEIHCEEHPDHQSGMITNSMIQQRLHEEIDELREYIEKRTWVGLTPSEIDEIIEDAIDPMDALLQTMDKLKDKNI